ncbi:MAG TPA: FecR domain-containing protein [Candidatus Binatia bacterium]|nr:FecR domain-containing protein [Candidatus Binatia bacterium]
MKFNVLAASILLPMAVLPGLASAEGGIAIHVTPPVSVVRQGQPLPAEVGTIIAAGDVIKTGTGAGAQFRFDDNSAFAVPGGSELRVDEFRLPKQGRGGSALFALLRGGFRTITGLIGKARGDTYEVRTGLATIGVRGSAYSAYLCDAKCAAELRSKVGLYVKAEKGLIIVKNAQGQLSLRPGQIAFVADAGTQPVLVSTSPFDNPKFAAGFDIDIKSQMEVTPPRIEHERPGSPS